ncbi:EamA family transporter [Halodesulfurarchaeum formicicum]|uniref:EamA family transporter n=1 Tax=Halodesulfurarchaeum formicicum TaxID=1873524 RepID=UPI0009031E0B|nr:EamA family transporter [Halodesulfurarchaeum formicicum]
MATTAIWLAVVTMVAWGGWAIFAKISTETISSDLATLVTYASASVFLLGNYLYNSQNPADFDPTGVTYALGAGIASAIGAVTMYSALKTGDASVVTPISGLYFVIAAVLGVLIFKEPIGMKKAAGLVFAVISITLVTQ